MNIFDIPREKLINESIEILLENERVRIEKIVSQNHVSKWYDQEEDEWVCLLSGESDIEFENTVKTLKNGEYIFIPKHVKHRVARTTNCVWLCVFIKNNNEE